MPIILYAPAGKDGIRVKNRYSLSFSNILSNLFRFCEVTRTLNSLVRTNYQPSPFPNRSIAESRF